MWTCSLMQEHSIAASFDEMHYVFTPSAPYNTPNYRPSSPPPQHKPPPSHTPHTPPSPFSSPPPSPPSTQTSPSTSLAPPPPFPPLLSQSALLSAAAAASPPEGTNPLYLTVQATHHVIVVRLVDGVLVVLGVGLWFLFFLLRGVVRIGFCGDGRFRCDGGRFRRRLGGVCAGFLMVKEVRGWEGGCTIGEGH